MTNSPQTMTKPTKTKAKVKHIAGSDRLDADRAAGKLTTPSICGAVALPTTIRYHVAELEDIPRIESRPCKRCLGSLEAAQRRYDNSVIKRLEKQFAGGRHD